MWTPHHRPWSDRAAQRLLDAYLDIEACHFLAADLAWEGNQVVSS
jgi:hypothetical protein